MTQPAMQSRNVSAPAPTLSLVDSFGLDVFDIASYKFGDEVFVADTDALFADAADVLKTGAESRLLAAIDTGVAIATMSDKTFRELGWVSASAARGHGVSEADLRALIEHEYLPRIPVVVVPPPDSGHWMPAAADVPDRDDVEHVQVARLICARMVYSHDKDLRGPGFAPRTRAEYDARIGHLTALASRKRTEHHLGVFATVTGRGVNAVVSRTATTVAVRPAIVWTALAVGAIGSVYYLLAPMQRRERLIERVGPLLKRAGAALGPAAEARQALSAANLIAPDDIRLETAVGAYLARHPDSTESDIAEALTLTADDRSGLAQLLRAHPSFEPISQPGWAVGRVRTELETFPSSRERI